MSVGDRGGEGGRGDTEVRQREKESGGRGRTGWRSAGKKWNRRIYERPAARDSSKIEAIPAVATLRMVERVRHVPLDACAIAVGCAALSYILR